MQVKINSTGGLELLDTDTNETFEFAGNLASLKSALQSGSLGQDQVNRIEIAGGELLLDELNIVGG